MNISDKKLVYALIGLPALAVAFFIGYFAGGEGGGSLGSAAGSQGADAIAAAAAATGNGQEASADQFGPFWKEWDILQQKDIYAASTSAQTKIWGAMQGLAASYNDPYTVFFPPQQAEDFQDDIDGSFGGVGMEIGMKNNAIVVIAPVKGTPAEQAGVKPGDTIIAIDGTSTADLTVDQAVDDIRGPIGSSVTVQFLAASSSKPVSRTMVRENIAIPTIDTAEKPGGVFVISLYSFTADSADMFRDALRKFVATGDHKLILDLRGNPGGYLDAAWDMASWFLPAGKTVVTEDFGQNGDPQVYRSKGYNIFAGKGLDMVILTDSGTASAAEILAGALSEQGVAKLVGTKTFGKGVVQELIPITDDTSLKVTVARWLTPNGHNLSHDGLDPDYAVPLTDANTAGGKDPQMDKALQLLGAAQ